MKARGFVMQASYRIRGDATVVHLHGRLEDGKTFLVRDARQAPCFYIRAADAARARDSGAARQRATHRRNFAGEPVTCIEVRTPPDAPPLRDRLQDRGIETFEADVRFAVRYLIDRDVKGGVALDGIARPGEAAGIRGVDWVFDDPEVGPADVDIAPRVLSFDIETDPKASRLLAISLYGCGLDEVVIVDGAGRAMPDRAVAAEDEHAALDAFCRRVAESDADVLTGWNVVDFDLSVLGRIAARVKHPFQLGREPGALRVRAAQGYFGSGQASIPGRVVLDGMDLVRGAFVRMDEYSLDAVARSVLRIRAPYEQRPDDGQRWNGSEIASLRQVLEHLSNGLVGRGNTGLFPTMCGMIYCNCNSYEVNMRISERGQITIPKTLRDRFGMSKDVEVEITPTDHGLLIQKRSAAKHPVERISGILDDAVDVDRYIEEVRGR